MVDLLKRYLRYDIYTDVLLPEGAMPRAEFYELLKSFSYEKLCELCSLFCSPSAHDFILGDWLEENTKLNKPYTFIRQITIHSLVRVGARSNSVYFHYYIMRDGNTPTGIQGLFPESLTRITKRIY